MTRAERIRLLQILLDNIGNPEWHKIMFELRDGLVKHKAALTDSIAEAEMMEKVAEGMPEKMPIWDSTDKGKMPMGLKLHSEGFNEALALCQASLVSRVGAQTDH